MSRHAGSGRGQSTRNRVSTAATESGLRRASSVRHRPKTNTAYPNRSQPSDANNLGIAIALALIGERPNDALVQRDAAALEMEEEAVLCKGNWRGWAEEMGFVREVRPIWAERRCVAIGAIPVFCKGPWQSEVRRLQLSFGTTRAAEWAPGLDWSKPVGAPETVTIRELNARYYKASSTFEKIAWARTSWGWWPGLPLPEWWNLPVDEDWSFRYANICWFYNVRPWMPERGLNFSRWLTLAFDQDHAGGNVGVAWEDYMTSPAATLRLYDDRCRDVVKTRMLLEGGGRVALDSGRCPWCHRGPVPSELWHFHHWTCDPVSDGVYVCEECNRRGAPMVERRLGQSGSLPAELPELIWVASGPGGADEIVTVHRA